MTLRLACHWAVTAGSALALADVFATPFPRPGALAVAFVTSVAVGFIGYAIAPEIRKEGRP